MAKELYKELNPGQPLPINTDLVPAPALKPDPKPTIRPAPKAAIRPAPKPRPKPRVKKPITNPIINTNSNSAIAKALQELENQSRDPVPGPKAPSPNNSQRRTKKFRLSSLFNTHLPKALGFGKNILLFKRNPPARIFGSSIRI